MVPVNRQAAHGVSGRGLSRDASPLVYRNKVLSQEELDEIWETRPREKPKKKKKRKGVLFSRRHKKKRKLTLKDIEMARENKMRSFCVKTLKEIIVQPCAEVYGRMHLFEIVGHFANGERHPLRKLPRFSERLDCQQFLEDFVVRRKAECAAVLLSKRLAVKVAETITRVVTDDDFAHYFPVESREMGLG